MSPRGRADGAAALRPAASAHRSRRIDGLLRWSGPALIATLGLILLHLSWLKWPHVLIDFGRELYIPWQLAEGKRLYADIAYFLGPLSPYLNALWFRLFGVSLLTLAMCNIALLAVLIILLYSTFLQFAGRMGATVAGLTFVGIFAFGQYVGVANYNYVCPYTHEAVHGLLLGIAAIACWAAYLRAERLPYLAGSGLALGLAFLTRLEPFAASAAALTVGLILRLTARSGAKSSRFVLIATFCAAAATPPLLAFGFLCAILPPHLALHGTLASLLATVGTGVSKLRFFQEGMGLLDVRSSLFTLLIRSATYVLLFGAAAALAALLHRPSRYRLALATLASVLVAGTLIWQEHSIPWFDMFRPLPLVALAVAAVATLGLVRARSDPDATRRLTLWLMWAIFAFVLLGKIILNARVQHYGFTLAMPATLLLAVAAVDWIPAALTRRGAYGPASCGIALAVLAAAGVAHVRQSQRWFATKTYTIGTGRDAFRTDPSGELVAAAVAELEQHLTPAQTLAVLPEGPMLNYLARRANPTPYVQLMPTELVVFGEAPVLAAFQAHPPDFIALVHKDTSEFGFRFFGRDYGQKLMAWIRREYGVVRQYGPIPLKGDYGGILILDRIGVPPESAPATRGGAAIP